MKKRKAIAGKLDASRLRVGIVVSRFNAFITDRLLAGALEALEQTGARAKNIKIVRVPGAFEIPQVAGHLARSKKYDALIALGCILRGETPHFASLSQAVAKGLEMAAVETKVPIAFGVLTCETLEQAIHRAGAKAGNKGFEAALCAVEMADLSRKI